MKNYNIIQANNARKNKVVFDGKEYESQVQLARALKVSEMTISRALRYERALDNKYADYAF